jgi:ribosomal protein L12E/L44/L45/RPP1/RPP2
MAQEARTPIRPGMSAADLKDLSELLSRITQRPDERLMKAFADDLNGHVSAIRSLGGRAVLDGNDIHNLLVRWQCTLIAAAPRATATAEESSEAMRRFEDMRPNRLRALDQQNAAEIATRGRSPHPTLSGGEESAPRQG